MVRCFTASALTADEIAPAFPLLHASAPNVDFATWRSFARHLVDPVVPGALGAICLRNEAGYLCGVLTYRTDRHLEHGTVLTVDLFAALDVVGDGEATHALLQSAEEKARALRCAALQIYLNADQNSPAKRIAAAGYRAGGKLFGKSLARRPAPA